MPRPLLNHTDASAKLKPMSDWTGTGNKTFDKFIKYIGTGNVCGGGGQSSNYIRAHSTLECNGLTNAPGHLREFDLKSFQRNFETLRNGKHVKNWLYAHKDEPVILYMFYHRRGDKLIVHGWIITDTDYKHRATIYKCHDAKAMAVIDTIEPFISWKDTVDTYL